MKGDVCLYSSMRKAITAVIISLVLVNANNELYCYSCTSAQSGCGDPIDVRLMHWKRCRGTQLFENYCVKLIKKVADQTVVTRGCLSDLLLNAAYRLDMPQLRRHGYCVNSRDYQQYLLHHLKGQTLAETAMGLFSDGNEDYKRFCYCNDWNGCNKAVKNSKSFGIGTLVLSTMILTFVNHLIHSLTNES